MIAGPLALIVAAAFAGAAIYITLAIVGFLLVAAVRAVALAARRRGAGGELGLLVRRHHPDEPRLMATTKLGTAATLIFLWASLG